MIWNFIQNLSSLGHDVWHTHFFIKQYFFLISTKFLVLGKSDIYRLRYYTFFRFSIFQFFFYSDISHEVRNCSRWRRGRRREIRKEKSGGGRQFYHVNHPELLVIISELIFSKINFYFGKFASLVRAAKPFFKLKVNFYSLGHYLWVLFKFI